MLYASLPQLWQPKLSSDTAKWLLKVKIAPFENHRPRLIISLEVGKCWYSKYIIQSLVISWCPFLKPNVPSGADDLEWGISSVQSLSHVQLFATPWIAACQAPLSIANSRSLLKLMSIKSVMPSSHLILCHPLLLLPPIPPSIRVFSNQSTLCIRWPKCWSFSFSISPSSEHPGLISFRRDWLDLLAVQGTLKSLLQYHSSKASIFWHSAFFSVQLSHPYMTTWKTIALTRWTFVGKAMSLVFNMLSRLVITFLPRSKHLLISWLQSPSIVSPIRKAGSMLNSFPFCISFFFFASTHCCI